MVSRPVYTGRGNWPETRQRRPGGPGWRLGAWPVRLLVLVAAVGGVLWFLLQAFEVKTIEVKASSGGEHIQQVAQGLVNGKWWWQRSLLTLDTGELESALEQTDPMIKAVDVRRKWPHGLALAVTLKEAGLGWASGDQQYLLDRDGSAVGVLPAGSLLPVVFDGSNLPVTVGKPVTSTRFVAFTTAIAAGLPALGLTGTRYEVKDTTYDLTVTTNKGYRLILDTTRPANDTLSDLGTLLTFLGKQGKAPAQYIDLRIAGKAYYQ